MFVRLTYWNRNTIAGNVWEVDRTDGETFDVTNRGNWPGLRHINVPASDIERVDDETAAHLIDDAAAQRDAENAASPYNKPATHRADPSDAGCWIDGWWGQYSIAHMVSIAEDFGFTDAALIDIADRHLASMGPSDTDPISDDEHETLSDAADDVEQWLTEHVAPERDES